MQFLAPMMLAGAAAVSIPVALHFFYRARYKPLPWAPMRFLKEAIEQTSRRLKFQEWILLLLRCLAILLLALALARPGFKTATTATRGEAVDAVLVFDTSYSMAARDGDKTRLERAKDAALTILDTLPANSSVQIFGCSDRATFLGPVARFNMDQARQLIPTIEVTSLSGDLLPGLAEALTASKNGSSPAKEIYVLTDMQKSGFERQQGAIKAKCEEIKSQANLVFVRCSNPERRIANVAVTDVSLISDIPHTKTRVPFRVTLKNTGSEPVKSLRVGLELDGKSIEKDAVPVEQIDPGQEYPVTLTGSLDEPGARVLTVEITGDNLPGDNVLYKIILVRDKVRVLLVDGTANPDDRLEGGDHFVKTALNPGRIRDYFIESDSVSAAEASPQHLNNRDIVYLLNAPIRDADPLAGMSNEFLSKLNEFVRGGGGLIIGCGDLLNATNYNKTLGTGGYQLLPFDLTTIQNTTEESPYTPAPETVEEASFVAPFRQSPFSDVLRFPIYRMFDLNEGTPTGRVLIRTTAGRPFLVSKVVGEGEVVMTTTSLDEKWGKFPAESRAFVPFTRFAIAHLTGRRVPGGTKTAGDLLTWIPPETMNSGFELVKPQKPGEKHRERVKLEVTEPAAGQPRLVTTGDTLRAGIYHIVPAGKADDSGPMFAVNPDLRETIDLTSATDSDVESWLGYRPPIIVAGAGTETAINNLRTHSEWTEWFLLLLLAILVTEAIWAWSCGRAW